MKRRSAPSYGPHGSGRTTFFLRTACVPVQVGHIVSACSNVGYVPSGAEALVQLAGRTYQKLIAQRSYSLALKLLHALTTLQLFLDAELSNLFTLETLEALDLYMAGSSIGGMSDDR